MPDDDVSTTEPPLQDNGKPAYFEVEEAQRPATCRVSSATSRLDSYKPEYFKVVEQANRRSAATAMIARTNLPVVDTKPEHFEVEEGKGRPTAVAFAITRPLPLDNEPEYYGAEEGYEEAYL
jgi:hypothetical protein